jgi:hypothetical protein
MSPEHGRWATMRRAGLGRALAARTPSLINAPGLTAIDGVAVGTPRYDENKPLRDRPPVINTVAGAIAIQEAFEMHEWGQQSGQSPIVWARHLRSSPLGGDDPKPVIIQFARGDQNSNNPGTFELLRAGGLADRTLHYRHDLAFEQDPDVPKNPHGFFLDSTSPNSTVRSVSRGAQDQVGAFFASDGNTIIHPAPAELFEVPVQPPLTEALNYIP